jgi:hypothetical protein
MLNRDVTKSAVIIIIAASMGTIFVSSAPASLWTNAQGSPQSREWKWENATFVAKHDIFVRPGEFLEIRNSTIEMDSSRRTVGIRVLGFLSLINSTIRSHTDTGYYFEIYGKADIENSNIEGVSSIDPMGKGMIVAPQYFQLRGSTLKSDDGYAATFYIPSINSHDFIVDSDVQGIMLVNSYINARNSTLGNLYVKFELGEFNLWNCTYAGAAVSKTGYGLIHSWKYLQVHTSQPESDLTISSVEDQMVEVTVTDKEGNFRAWWLSKTVMLRPLSNPIEVDNNPFTFEATKTVENDFPIADREGVPKRMGVAQDYYGITVQDIDENPLVEVEMRLK